MGNLSQDEHFSALLNTPISSSKRAQNQQRTTSCTEEAVGSHESLPLSATTSNIRLESQTQHNVQRHASLTERLPQHEISRASVKLPNSSKGENAPPPVCAKLKEKKEVKTTRPSTKPPLECAPTLSGIDCVRLRRYGTGEHSQGGLDGEDSDFPDEKLLVSFDSCNALATLRDGPRDRHRNNVYPVRRARVRPWQPALNAAKSPSNMPDRFVNPRFDIKHSHEGLYVNELTSKLSVQEKSFRRRTNRSDPFGPDFRIVLHNASDQTARSHRRVLRPSFVSDGQPRDDMLNRDNLRPSESPARASASGQARAWPTPSAHQEPSDGRANVPVHRSRFLGSITSESDLSLHCKRLALACDIDSANKILSQVSSTFRTQSAPFATQAWPTAISPGLPM
ncbi:MAG: hypothetical protein Q9159_006589 [Coniocarpon cinnabarinum]